MYGKLIFINHDIFYEKDIENWGKNEMKTLTIEQKKKDTLYIGFLAVASIFHQ